MNDSLSEPEFQFIRKWMRTHVGQDLGEDKQYLIQVALSEIQQKYKIESIEQTVKRLNSILPMQSFFSLQSIIRSGGQNASFVQDVVDALMVGETYFFRRPSTFEDLRSIILPTLIQRRQNQRRLRIWSSACSSGQEAYSLAMTLEQFFPDVYAHWDLKIIATDISQKALDKARAGTYSDWETTRGLSADLKDRFFTKNGMFWTANDSLKSCIQFTQNNLIESMESVPNWPFDLVLVRNVLIYFHPDTKREILAKLRPLITDDGLLLMGESETLLGLEDHFSISNITPALCIPK
jgi:chemotaxis protein methyltransferase CheR